MNKTVKTGQTSRRQLSKKGVWLMTAMFVSTGLMIVLMALDVIHVDPSDIHAPRWVLAASGMMFVFAGLVIPASQSYSGGEPTLWVRLIGWLIMVCFALVFNWVAFGPGEREFTTSVNDIVVGNSGERSGRIVFGFFAVLIDLWLVWGTCDFLKKLIRKD
ncbi:MAG: hypothetical protein K9M17_08340 [Mariprofundaceae bacterium]|nr:hypothetical protein [Mariprofundaceae bacterium]